LLVAMVGGCGAQTFLGTTGEHLFVTKDALVRPGEDVTLEGRLQGGEFLHPMAGHVVRFYRDGALIGAAETNDDGVARLTVRADGVGDTRFVVDVAPAGFAEAPPEAQELLVACRSAETPMVVVDLDKTLVASGFHVVLVGDPEPMAGSVGVLTRLAQTHTIVYLTHRPDYFGITSKRWLARHGYPPGPVLLSTVRGWLQGSGQFKRQMLASLRERFPGLSIGIGDKISDAAAYRAEGLAAFLILPVDEGASPDAIHDLADRVAALDDTVQVVTTWREIEQGLFEKARFPRDRMVDRLRDLAQQRRSAQPAEVSPTQPEK